MCHGRWVLRAELHFHLLPGVDDGPVDMAESVELARLAVADGTSVVTVTPHVRDLLRRRILDEIPARVEAPDAVAAELRAGARLQVNGSSLTGRHGAHARAWGIELLRSGRADVIASDAHRVTRPPLLSAAL